MTCEVCSVSVNVYHFKCTNYGGTIHFFYLCYCCYEKQPTCPYDGTSLVIDQ